MRESESSYQTARRDLITAAAVIGTVATARWAYRKYKSRGGDFDRDTEALLMLLGFLAVLPIRIPAFLYHRRTCAVRARKKIARWETESGRLHERLAQTQARLDDLALSQTDRPGANSALAPIERQIDRLDQLIFRSAEMLVTRIHQDVTRLQSRRTSLLSNIESFSQLDLRRRLDANAREL